MTTGSMPIYPGVGSATLLYSGQVLAGANDYYDGTKYVNAGALFNPQTETWSVTSPISSVHSYQSATLLPNGNLMLAAGFNTAVTRTVDTYNSTPAFWSSTVALWNARKNHTATLLPYGNVLVTGGYNINPASNYPGLTHLKTFSIFVCTL
jgi:hypothetical protein